MAGGAYLIVDRFAVFVALSLFFGNGPCRLVCDMLFYDVIRWKSRKIVRDLWRAQKGNSYILNGIGIIFLTNTNMGESGFQRFWTEIATRLFQEAKALS